MTDGPRERRRTAGLDTLRAAAIVLVFTFHYDGFISPVPVFGWLGEVGWTGVDLFFVLSGYLIGNQLLGAIARGQPLTLGAFYARRALRTLPAFWGVLACYWLLPGRLGGATPPPLWRFLTFTQNLGLAPGTAFSHAWSLCIEEQFYLVLPLVLVVGRSLGLGRRSGWTLLGALATLGIVVRAVRWTRYGGDLDDSHGYMTNIYYATLCRADELLPGIALATWKNFHPGTWRRAMAHGRALLVAGAVATSAVLVAVQRFSFIEGVGHPFFMTAFGYSLVAASFALLVLAALSPVSLLHRMRIPGASHLALWSYSIYLSHKGAGHVMQRWLAAHGVGRGGQVALVSLGCIAAGALLFALVEGPGLRLRDRLFGSRAPTSAIAPAPALVPSDRGARTPRVSGAR